MTLIGGAAGPLTADAGGVLRSGRAAAALRIFIERMRPGVVDLQEQSTASGSLHRRLQRVIAAVFKGPHSADLPELRLRAHAGKRIDAVFVTLGTQVVG